MPSSDGMASAMTEVANYVDSEKRVWILGLARLNELADGARVDDATAAEILDFAAKAAGFPVGPVAYRGQPVITRTDDGYRTFTLTVPDAPWMIMRIGLVVDHYVAIGFTRSGVFEDGSEHPHGVLLTDVEAVYADLLTLATATAVALGATGEIETALWASPAGPGAAPTFLALDPERGRLEVRRSQDEPMEPVRHDLHVTAQTSRQELEADAYDVLARAADHYWSTTPQFVQQPDFAPSGEPVARLLPKR